ncbi:MAG: ribonuclease Y [candidate division WOR-3 bacterium]|nr:ribonuclease Y [candidate division WOR-3 bacterium]
MNTVMTVVLYILVAAIFLVIGYFTQKIRRNKKILTAESKAEKLIKEALKKSKETEEKTREKLEQLKREQRRGFIEETKAQKKHLDLWEKELERKDKDQKRTKDFLSQKEKNLMAREKEVQKEKEEAAIKRKRYTQLIEEKNKRLEEISRMTPDEAKELLLNEVKQEVENKAIQIENDTIAKAKKKAKRKAADIITEAIQRCAPDIVIDSTVSSVSLPSENMKGRIIGREGRNIRAFEKETGIDVIIDDTPEAVTLSGFHPIKREIARVSMEKLIKDGRIHPARIEEIVQKTKEELDERITEIGENAIFELGLPKINDELVKMIGKLSFRSSYGQNVLQHSKEVAYLMGVMAGELQLDVNLAKRAGILHDIGKGMSQEYSGSHAEIGADAARKYGESPIVVNAIAAHHEEIQPESPIAVLLQAADAISGARPGARRETLEAYIRRVEELEKIASSFKGIKKVYAMQAGREVRIIVQPESISDNGTRELATKIARKIEGNLTYPGEIRVTVIRETRAVEHAE